VLLAGKSSFCEDVFENLCGIPSLDTSSASDIVSSSCMRNCRPAKDEMKLQYVFLLLPEIQQLYNPS